MFGESVKIQSEENLKALKFKDVCINAYLHVYVAPTMVEILSALHVASVTCGLGPCTGCSRNDRSRFGRCCTAALLFSSGQDQLAWCL